MKQPGNSERLVPISIIAALFFVFGFITWLNGSLIPFLQIACELTQFQAYFVTLAFYISYTFMALPVSIVLRRLGYKRGLALGLCIMSVGALLFVPAAQLRYYPFFLVALFVLGTGLTLLQTSANPYIVLIGPRETAAVRISIMGLLNKGAGIVAPIVFTALVLGDVASFEESSLILLTPSEKSMALDGLAQRLIFPYLILASSLALLAVCIKLSPLPDPVFEQASGVKERPQSILQRPRVVLGVAAIFFGIAAEVVAGDTIGLLGRELGVESFAQLTAWTMSFMMCGYLLGLLLIPRVVTQESALTASALLGILLTFSLVTVSPESTSIWDVSFGWVATSALPNAVMLVALFGLANALIWPAVWPLALRDLDEAQTSLASALLIMGIAGGAIIPLVFGAVADTTEDVRSPYWVMLPCYLFILHYALKGHRMEDWSRSA